ncbi:hypothetical protein AZE42_09064 [Rhizopogon vesiculosus]|uniref:Aminoglycoside phosphotransferase domain-containing protein n=1 Tax=Rhizopogon vesiculosus TaxID=180088 RepID=A0A1J8R2G3_9AGAM|nr:hypothetical protein AZE42_09064 [Rhizopogon vesiculosus]
MSSSSGFGFLVNDDLPSRDDIIAICSKAGECRGILLRNQPGEPIAWVKCGPNVTIDEALTQDWVARSLEATLDGTVRVPRVYDAFSVPTTSWTIGFIVMEYIDAPDCTEKNVKRVAQAVQALISVRGPSSAPGHVCGGPVIHSFFIDDWTSPFRYETVDELEQHINGILRVGDNPKRVSLVTDASDGLYLCPCDINPRNFKKLPDGKVVALDFRASCFLPPSFFAVTMAKAMDHFIIKVARHVKYPISGDVAVMTSASYSLVPYGRNDIGAPKSLRRRKEL